MGLRVVKCSVSILADPAKICDIYSCGIEQRTQGRRKNRAGYLDVL